MTALRTQAGSSCRPRQKRRAREAGPPAGGEGAERSGRPLGPAVVLSSRIVVMGSTIDTRDETFMSRRWEPGTNPPYGRANVRAAPQSA
jgi:hypothetical protein